MHAVFDITKRATWRPLAHNEAMRSLGTLPGRLASVVALPWLIIASALAIFSATAAVVVGWRIAGNLPDPDRAGVAINVAALGVALLISIGTGLALPSWWRRIGCAAVIIPAMLVIATSGHTLAALTATAILVPTAWLGRSCAASLIGPIDRLTAWIVGCAFGFGITAALGFVLGSAGLLRPALIWPLLLGLTGALFLTKRRHVLDDLHQFTAWLRRPSRRDHLTLLLVGIGIALLWYNLIGALSPETASDTARVRLATATYFAQTRHLAADSPELYSIIQTPAVGEIANAVVASIGPLQAVKLLTFLQGIACAIAIFAVDRRLHSSQAGLLAAFTFYSMPLVSWLSQTAYLDLLTSLLAVSAALIIVSCATPGWRVAVAAGIIAGLGVGVKLHFGYVAIGLAIILGVLGFREQRPWAILRLLAVMTATAALTAAPWLIRSALVSGQIPGLALATESLARAQDEQPAALADLTSFGFGRSFGHLLRSFFDMTMFSAQFEWPPTRYGPFGGLIGFGLLGLLPLVLVIFPARRRLTLALLAGGVIAFVFWFYSAQYLRYSLPILALLCPLAGVTYSVTQERGRRETLRFGSRLALLVLIFSGVILQLQVPAMGRFFVLGREDAGQYLDRNLICCAGYPVMRLLNAEPGVTRVFSTVDLARIYTTVRISTPYTGDGTVGAAHDEAALLRGLDEGGYSHIVIDRNRLGRGWELGPLAGESFLRRNTTLVGGQGNVYLYRLLPADQRGVTQSWTTGDELLANGNFEVTHDRLPIGWRGTGTVGNIGDVPSSSVAVLVSGANILETTIPVTPDTTYLLSHFTRGDAGAGTSKAALSLAWRDAAGQTIATMREIVQASPQGYHQFSTVGIAPPTAVTVVVTIAAEEGAVWFDDLSLRARTTGGARP